MAALKRLSLIILEKILAQLIQHGKTKRTRLALTSKLPYDRFTKYLQVMIRLELVVLEPTQDGIFVNVTELGKRYLQNSLLE